MTQDIIRQPDGWYALSPNGYAYGPLATRALAQAALDCGYVAIAGSYDALSAALAEETYQ